MFRYLHYGLSLVLSFIGVKMLIAHYFVVPTAYALATVGGILLLSVLASVIHPAKKAA